MHVCRHIAEFVVVCGLYCVCERLVFCEQVVCTCYSQIGRRFIGTLCDLGGRSRTGSRAAVGGAERMQGRDKCTNETHFLFDTKLSKCVFVCVRRVMAMSAKISVVCDVDHFCITRDSSRVCGGYLKSLTKVNLVSRF